MNIVWIALAALGGALGAVALNYVVFGRVKPQPPPLHNDSLAKTNDE